jgi:anti-sigma factor RsiW
MVDERIEILISRKLDGALTEAESLELDKALIRNPEARCVLAEYEANDAVAATSLNEMLSPADSSSTPSAERIEHWAQPSNRAAGSIGRHLGYFGGAAVAAMIALSVIGIPQHLTAQSSPSLGESFPAVVAKPPAVSVAAGQPGMRPPSRRSPSETAPLPHSRDLFGIYDHRSSRLYLFEFGEMEPDRRPPPWSL